MRTTFYIHIGVHKTGSTSIQQTMLGNRDKLLARGVNYLSIESNHGPLFISLLADVPHKDTRNIRRFVDTPAKARLYNLRNKWLLKSALWRNRSPKFVISGEGLSSLKAHKVEKLKRLLDPYAAAYRIIVYVRDPYEYANSVSLQRLKSGAVLGAPGRELLLPQYRRKIQKYIRIFGRENVDIRIFDPRRFVSGDLICDFLFALGEAPESSNSLEVVRANKSMSHEAAMILSETNVAIPMSINGLANRERAFGFHLYVAGIAGEKFSIEPSAYLQQEKLAEADLQWLHKVLGERAFGRSIPRPASSPRWSEATARSIEDLVRQMTVTIQELKAQGNIQARFTTRLRNALWPLRRRWSLGRLADYNFDTELTVPAGLEWLEDAIKHPQSGRSQSSLAPDFDQATIRALGCFLHHLAMTIQRLKGL